MRAGRWVLGGVVAVITACTSAAPAADKPTVTQRQKDSVVGASALPGAGGVRGAITAGDSAAARNQQLDSLAKTP